jgi:D-aminopeptidase
MIQMTAEPLRQRPFELGITSGIYARGPKNAITDVAGVYVGHTTLVEGEDIRTGVTAVLPHSGNLYQERVPAGLAVANGFGKLAGATQLLELGELETPLVLTNTLAVPAAATAIISWTLAQPGNQTVRSVNPVVGETNDGGLNDIRRRAVEEDHVLGALRTAQGGAVVEGAVGAGTGTICFGWKGGIGTASRRLPANLGDYTMGILVETNFGGQLAILGLPFPDLPSQPPDPLDGSIMILVATDAPLSDRNLRRLAARSFAGLARSGSSFSNGSGDYAIAFSTHQGVRRTADRRRATSSLLDLPNDLLSPLFQAAIEATEEAVLNSLWAAETMTGFQGRTVPALPQPLVLARLRAAGRI